MNLSLNIFNDVVASIATNASNNMRGRILASCTPHCTAINYDIFGDLTYENVDGVYIVNCDGTVLIKNKKIEKLTDGFVWCTYPRK